jgi:hypothetical protein
MKNIIKSEKLLGLAVVGSIWIYAIIDLFKFWYSL